MKRFSNENTESLNLNPDLWKKEAELFASIRDTLNDVNAPIKLRQLALQTIVFLPGDKGSDVSIISQCLDPRNPTELQLAAIDSLASILESETPVELLKNWNQSSPVFATRLSRPSWQEKRGLSTSSQPRRNALKS